MKLSVLNESKNKAGCVVVDGKNVLLIKKKGAWQLPKGSARNNEPLIDAAIRETKEETGIRSSVSKHAELYTIGNTTFFLVDEWSGKINPSKKENISKCRWVPIENALRKIIPAHARALEHFSGYIQK